MLVWYFAFSEFNHSFSIESDRKVVVWQGAYHGWDDFPLFSAGKSRHRTQGLVHWKISPTPSPSELFIAWKLRSPSHHHPSFRRHLFFRRFIATYTLFLLSLCSWLLASLSDARFVVLHHPCFFFSSAYILPFKSIRIESDIPCTATRLDGFFPSIASGPRLHTPNSRPQTLAFRHHEGVLFQLYLRLFLEWGFDCKLAQVLPMERQVNSCCGGRHLVSIGRFRNWNRMFPSSPPPRDYCFCQWGTFWTNLAIGIQLRTERLITCNQSVPQWILSLFGGSPTSYVHETSYVDPILKKVTMCSTNLTWSNVLSVRETVSYNPSPSNPNSTDFNQEAKITALCGGWQKIKNKLEEASVERFSQNATRGREGFEAVLEMSRRVFGEQREHEKKQIQSWTVYVDRTRSCEIRYLFSLCIHILSVLHRSASVHSWVSYSFFNIFSMGLILFFCFCGRGQCLYDYHAS